MIERINCANAFPVLSLVIVDVPNAFANNLMIGSAAYREVSVSFLVA